MPTLPALTDEQRRFILALTAALVALAQAEPEPVKEEERENN